MSDRASSIERAWLILKYLRENTDAEHPVRGFSAMRKAWAESALKDKDTFKDTVWKLAKVLNSDLECHPLPQEQWRIVFKAYLDRFGVTDEDAADSPSPPEEEDGVEGQKSGKREVSPPVENLYYQHPFSYQEIDEIIASLQSSQLVDSRETRRLIRKIKENLTSKFYPRGAGSVCKIQETLPVNWKELREKLVLIQRAIKKGVKIAFRFNGYGRDKKLAPVRAGKDIVSPYYCVAYEGRYYLLACQEKEREDGPERKMSIWRVDLMSELECLGAGDRALDKKLVEGLPQDWNEVFPFQHLYMGFDKPVDITLRVVNPWPGQDGGTWTNYTFLVDWFGDSFHYERTETEPPYGDIVRVTCSPWGMVNWALQFSDRVEVLEPLEVRAQVAEKIRALNEKYGIEK